MASQFYGYPEPQCISGPRITPGRGASWDLAEATFLCVGDPTAAGGFSLNDPFPKAPNFFIDGPPEIESVASNAYTVRVTGKGYKAKRVYSYRQSYTAGEMSTDLTIPGVPYATFSEAWPEVDLMLNAEGFRQIIVGAQNIVGDVGQKVSAPQEGSFPPPPPNPYSSIAKPRLQYPWGWVLAKRDADPLVEGVYNASGPWLLTLDYVWRHKMVPAG